MTKTTRVKSDFVTNSSSTSFVVWGCRFEIDELLPAVPKLVELCKCGVTSGNDLFCTKVLKAHTNGSLDSMGDIMDLVECAGNRIGIETSIGRTFCNTARWLYAGLHPREMPDTITLGESKKLVADWFELAGLPSKQVKFISLCWRDG